MYNYVCNVMTENLTKDIDALNDNNILNEYKDKYLKIREIVQKPGKPRADEDKKTEFLDIYDFLLDLSNIDSANIDSGIPTTIPFSTGATSYKETPYKKMLKDGPNYININENHWVQIYKQGDKYFYMDSSFSDNNYNLIKTGFNFSDNEIIKVNVPQQQNGCDCAIFSYLNGKYFEEILKIKGNEIAKEQYKAEINKQFEKIKSEAIEESLKEKETEFLQNEKLIYEKYKQKEIPIKELNELLEEKSLSQKLSSDVLYKYKLYKDNIQVYNDSYRNILQYKKDIEQGREIKSEESLKLYEKTISSFNKFRKASKDLKDLLEQKKLEEQNKLGEQELEIAIENSFNKIIINNNNENIYKKILTHKVIEDDNFKEQFQKLKIQFLKSHSNQEEFENTFKDKYIKIRAKKILECISEERGFIQIQNYIDGIKIPENIEILPDQIKNNYEKIKKLKSTYESSKISLKNLKTTIKNFIQQQKYQKAIEQSKLISDIYDNAILELKLIINTVKTLTQNLKELKEQTQEQKQEEQIQKQEEKIQQEEQQQNQEENSVVHTEINNDQKQEYKKEELHVQSEVKEEKQEVENQEQNQQGQQIDEQPQEQNNAQNEIQDNVQSQSKTKEIKQEEQTQEQKQEEQIQKQEEKIQQEEQQQNQEEYSVIHTEINNDQKQEDKKEELHVQSEVKEEKQEVENQEQNQQYQQIDKQPQIQTQRKEQLKNEDNIINQQQQTPNTQNGQDDSAINKQTTSKKVEIGNGNNMNAFTRRKIKSISIPTKEQIKKFNENKKGQKPIENKTIEEKGEFGYFYCSNSDIKDTIEQLKENLQKTKITEQEILKSKYKIGYKNVFNNKDSQKLIKEFEQDCKKDNGYCIMANISKDNEGHGIYVSCLQLGNVPQNLIIEIPVKINGKPKTWYVTTKGKVFWKETNEEVTKDLYKQVLSCPIITNNLEKQQEK